MVGAVLWFALVPEAERAREEPHRDAPEEASEAAPARPVAPAHARPTAAPESSVELSQAAEATVPRPHDANRPGMPSHPTSDERTRLHTINQLTQSLNDAMSFRRVKEMREMLEQYRKLDPDDIDASQAGYEVIADCIEFPGEASLTAAREFYATQRHSPLRRFVRRICFENSQ